MNKKFVLNKESNLAFLLRSTYLRDYQDENCEKYLPSNGHKLFWWSFLAVVLFPFLSLGHLINIYYKLYKKPNILPAWLSTIIIVIYSINTHTLLRESLTYCGFVYDKSFSFDSFLMFCFFGTIIFSPIFVLLGVVGYAIIMFWDKIKEISNKFKTKVEWN